MPESFFFFLPVRPPELLPICSFRLFEKLFNEPELMTWKGLILTERMQVIQQLFYDCLKDDIIKVLHRNTDKNSDLNTSNHF